MCVAVVTLLSLLTLVPSLALRAQGPEDFGANLQERAAADHQAGATAKAEAVPPEWRAALERIEAESLRGHLSFIASDLLEGRATPSRGLDIAAEYIAAQFRRAGLEPAGDDGYFQTAEWRMTGSDMSAFKLSFDDGGAGLDVGHERASVGLSISRFTLFAPDHALALDGAGVVKLAHDDAAALDALAREDLAGKVVVTELPDPRRAERERVFALLQNYNAFLSKLHEKDVALVVSFDRAGAARRSEPRLVDPESPARSSPFGGGPTAPLVTVHGAEAAKFYDALPAGATRASVAFRAPAKVERPVKLRNVAGILRGSDPALKDEYVMLSAHYDHTGTRENCAEGEDCIYNGANDDGSGTVAVIEMASALSKLPVKPKRSILFMTFFGEELGLRGSRYYGRHPLVPLSKTVAQVNLEQVGRTDDSEGPQVGTATLTGFDYSDVGEVMRRAGERVGVSFYKHPANSDAFFSRSDNQALADVGVPAHALGVAFEFPDYHGLGDEWEKIDYANMAKVVRATALGALMLADAAQPPRWNESNPKAARYVEAWRKLHGAGAKVETQR